MLLIHPSFVMKDTVASHRIASHQCSSLEQLRCAITATDIIRYVFRTSTQRGNKSSHQSSNM